VLGKAANDLLVRGRVPLLSLNVEDKPDRKKGERVHPISQGLEDVLALIHGVARDKHRLLGVEEQLSHDNAGVAITGPRRLGARGDKIHQVLGDASLISCLEDEFKRSRQLRWRKLFGSQSLKGRRDRGGKWGSQDTLNASH
jgi:hypothetical protein